MTITIDPALKAACPDLAVGVVEANARVMADDSALWAEVEETLAEMRRTLTLADLPALPPIKALRRAYRAVGKDPTRYRGSQEALLRRVLKGSGLYRVNTIVDINNLVSIESRHSLGTFDLDRVVPPVVFRIGQPGEAYKGIGKDVLNLEGMPLYADAEGAFGSTTSDSERAMIRPETTRVLMVINAFSGTAGLEQTIARAAALLCTYAAADPASVKTAIVT
ncbi:hypothetical protein A33M_0656 [Rhodovulum sp. PH10]|uniref:B3/B4 domain-containing protein n=1 Tax=Rhodovulum sp. PH10 TaxID=1187851 RepID=UPI00027C2BD1|nr:phenylalanine--tRNA ligase beta subunit-related protein [Rhodovulum sp. PH10]EJW10037.1 hypothetical protein A33M_0656 [Rhodovulum sp. PH10]